MDKVQEFYNHLKERFSSPFFSAFVISWSIFNWKALVCLIMFEPSMLDRVFYQTYICCISDQTTIYSNFLFPFLSALGYTFGYPLVRGFLKVFNTKVNKSFGNWDLEVKKGTAVEIDKFMAMQDEVEKLQKTLKDRIDKNSQNLVNYQQQLTENQQKDVQINDLENQLLEKKNEMQQALEKAKSDCEKDKIKLRNELAQLNNQLKNENQLNQEQISRITILKDQLKAKEEELRERMRIIDDLTSGVAIRSNLNGHWLNEHQYNKFSSQELALIEDEIYLSYDGNKFHQIATVKNLSYNNYLRDLVFNKELIDDFAYSKSNVLPPRGKNLFNELKVSDDWKTLSGYEDSAIKIRYTRLDDPIELDNAMKQMKAKFGLDETKIEFIDSITGNPIVYPANKSKISSEFINANNPTGSISVWVKVIPVSDYLSTPKNNGYVVATAGNDFSHNVAIYKEKKEYRYQNVFALSLSPNLTNTSSMKATKVFWRFWLANSSWEHFTIESDPLDNNTDKWYHLMVRWDHPRNQLDFLIDGTKVTSSDKENYFHYWPSEIKSDMVLGSWGLESSWLRLGLPIARLHTTNHFLSDNWLKRELLLGPAN